MNKIKLLCLKFLLIMIILLISFFVLEGVSRLLFPQHFYVNLPNVKNDIETKLDFNYTASTNSLGLREDMDYPFKKDNNTLRIFVIGDSFTFGEGVNLNETYSKFLERDLAKKYPNLTIEVINAGKNGASPLEYLEVLKFIVDKYDYNFIIIGFFSGNDIYDNFMYEQRQSFLNTGIKKYVKKSNLLMTLYYTLRKNNLFNKLALTEEQRIAKEEGGALTKQIEEKYGGEINSQLTVLAKYDKYAFLRSLLAYPWNESNEYLDKNEQVFISAKNSTDNKLLVVNFPFFSQVTDKYNFFYKEIGFVIYDNLTKDYNLDNYLKNIFSANNINFINLRDNYKKCPECFYLHDGHINSKGHNIAADKIASCLNIVNNTFVFKCSNKLLYGKP